MKPTKLIIRVVKKGRFKGNIDIFNAEHDSSSMFTCFDEYGHSDASPDYYYQDTRAAKAEEIKEGEHLIKKVFGEGRYIIVKKMTFPKRLYPVQTWRKELIWA